MDIGGHEFHPGSPPAREDLSNDYPISFHGQRGNIRTKNERLSGGSTSDVRKGIFQEEGSDRVNPVTFKIYNHEPLGSSAESPWRIGPAEAGVLNANIPGIAKAYDWGWLHNGSRGQYLDVTMNPAQTPLEVSARTRLPSQFAIAVELLDSQQNIHPEELWILVRNGLTVDPYAAATAEGAGKILELMRPYGLLEKGFVRPQQFGEDLLVSAAWVYFNTKIALQKAGWDISDFNPSKNFVFDPKEKRWRLYDFGVADPANEKTLAFVGELLGRDFQSVIAKRKELLKKIEETRASNPADPGLLRSAYLTEFGLQCLTMPLFYKIPNAGPSGNFKPTGEGLTKRLNNFIDWVYSNEAINSLEGMRDRIGEFIYNKMGGSSDATEIVEKTVGQGYELGIELLKKKSTT